MDKHKPWREYPVVVWDVETTGLDPERDRVVEMAAVLFLGDEIRGVVAGVVDPGRPIPPEATEIHGISDEMVAEHGRPFADLWREAVAMCRQHEETVCAAYNAPFDRGFLRAEAHRVDLHDVPIGVRLPWLDPLVWVRERDRFERGAGRHRLAPTCERWGVELRNGHAAEDDAVAAGQLLRSPTMRSAVASLTPGGTEPDPSLAAVLGRQVKLHAEQEARHREWRRSQDRTLGQGAECRSCRAAITWVETAGGRRMPLDLVPSPVGTVLVTDDGRHGTVLTGDDLVAAREARRALRLSHLATCPNAANAAKHRVPKRGAS